MMHHHHGGAGESDPTFAAKARSTGEILRRVAIYLKPYKLMALGTMSCALLSLGFSLVFPKLIGAVIDDVIGNERSDLLMPVILALIATFLLRDAFNGLRILINN